MAILRQRTIEASFPDPQGAMTATAVAVRTPAVVLSADSDSGRKSKARSPPSRTEGSR